MKNIIEMRKAREAKIEEMRALRRKAASEDRMMNGEETRQFDEMDKAQEAMRQEIERESKLTDLEKDSKQVSTRSLVEPTEPEPTPTPKPDKSMKDVHGSEKRFENMADFILAVKRASEPSGHVDSRLTTRAASGLNESVPSDGGFLVQKDFATELLKRAYETGQLAKRCRRIPVSGNGIKINAIDESSRVTGSRLGGITGYWAGEADQKTASKPKFRQLEMNLQKLVGLCYLTDEISEDASVLNNVVNEGFAQEFGFLIDDGIVNGDGVGKPQGFMNSPSLVTVSKESGPQTADTVVVQNLVKMRSRLWARSRPNALWLYNQDIEPQLHTLTLSGSSSNVAVYMPGGNIAGQPFDTILGIPAVPIEQSATIGDLGDIALVDLSQYLLIEKGGIKSDVSMHVRFIYDENVVRFVYRVNGQSIWDKPLTPFKGTNTQSPFVTLEAR